MTESHSDEILKILLNMQQLIHDNHRETTQEIEGVRQVIEARIDPIENKVNKHQVLFEATAKVLTWILPSGVLLSIMGWLSTNHK